MFEREDRYLVLKRKDIEKFLHRTERLELGAMVNWIGTKRQGEGRSREMPCVVVEADWPEYEKVWSMIENRIEGANA